MSKASEALAGTALPLFKINENRLSYYSLEQQNDLYVCVRLNGRWQWQRFQNISCNTFKKYRDKITETIQNLQKNSKKTDHELSIKISGAIGSNAALINGTYYPIPVLRSSHMNGHAAANAETRFIHNVYLRSGPDNSNHRRWLYFATNKTWHIGNSQNMHRRKNMGWLRDLKGDEVRDATYDIKPWTISSDKWNAWDGADNAGSWKVMPDFKIELDGGEQSPEDYRKLKDEFNKIQDMMPGLNKQIKQSSEINLKLVSGCGLLFNRLNKAEKQQLLNDSNTFHNIFNKNDLCACCFAVDKNITKCIHIDCPGACIKCRHTNGGGDGTCCACGKKQELKCPICLDIKVEENLEIFKCHHCSCHACLLKSYRMKKAIKKCPICRAKI